MEALKQITERKGIVMKTNTCCKTIESRIQWHIKQRIWDQSKRFNNVLSTPISTTLSQVAVSDLFQDFAKRSSSKHKCLVDQVCRGWHTDLHMWHLRFLFCQKTRFNGKIYKISQKTNGYSRVRSDPAAL